MDFVRKYSLRFYYLLIITQVKILIKSILWMKPIISRIAIAMQKGFWQVPLNYICKKLKTIKHGKLLTVTKINFLFFEILWPKQIKYCQTFDCMNVFNIMWKIYTHFGLWELIWFTVISCRDLFLSTSWQHSCKESTVRGIKCKQLTWEIPHIDIVTDMVFW